MRTAGKGGALAALLLASVSAAAQDTTTVPAQGIDRYSLPPGNSQATPTPSPSPTPAPTPAPTPTSSATPPAAVPTAPRSRATATPAPIRVSPTPTPTPVPITRPSPTTAPAPIDTRADAPQPLPSPTVTPPPIPVPTPTAVAPATAPEAVPATAPVEPGSPTWLWWALGLAAIAGVGLFGWRRLRPRNEQDSVEPDAVVPGSAVPVAGVPAVAPKSRPPAKPAAAAQPAAALALDLRPQRLWTRGPNAHLAFELIVTNTGGSTVESIRPVISLISAGPDTAADIAAFRSNASSMPSGEPFDLPAGKSCAIAGELMLPGDAMYVTTAADRELIVPVVLAGIGWRGGLSVARIGEAFVVGTGDAASARLGPIWVDRAGLVYERLDARQFTAGAR